MDCDIPLLVTSNVSVLDFRMCASVYVYHVMKIVFILNFKKKKKWEIK